MRVTFDSNVYRPLVSLSSKDTDFLIYKELKQAILDKKIEPFLSSTIFTLESITYENRKMYFKNYKPEITMNIGSSNGAIIVNGTFGSDKFHPGNPSTFEKHLNEAISLGFKLIYIVRSLNVNNQEIDKYYYQIDPNELEFFYDTSYKVAERISQLKAGIYHIEQIGNKYDKSWFIGVGKAPDSENERIKKAIAEWSDGDSVAAHIAIKGDYFCTKDVGKKGGNNSIFSKQNVAILEKEYGFNKVSPLELLSIMNKK